MESQVIIAFVENNPTYGLFVVVGKIQLKSKSSLRFLFKRLNEDILKSELTQSVYDARAKDLFEPLEEAAEVCGILTAHSDRFTSAPRCFLTSVRGRYCYFE